MSKIFLVFTATFFILISTSPLRAEQVVGNPLNHEQRTALFERLRQIQKGIHSFQANFVEERRIPSLKKPLRFEGEIFYHKSGLFFMKYIKPINHILKVRGNEALFYVKGSGTADIVDLSTVNGIPRHSDMLALNPDEFKGQVWQDAQGFRLEETRQGSTSAHQDSNRLTVFIDSKTLLIERILIEDASGDITELNFFNIEVNRPLPPSVLQFKLPEGTKINRLNQQ